MRGVVAFVIVATMARSSGTIALAVCLDDRGVSGYHIPTDKELQRSYIVIIATVIGEKLVPGAVPVP